jgi:hypothetical protein
MFRTRLLQIVAVVLTAALVGSAGGWLWASDVPAAETAPVQQALAPAQPQPQEKEAKRSDVLANHTAGGGRRPARLLALVSRCPGQARRPFAGSIATRSSPRGWQAAASRPASSTAPPTTTASRSPKIASTSTISTPRPTTSSASTMSGSRVRVISGQASPELVPALIKLLDDSDAEVRKAAESALDSLGGEAVPWPGGVVAGGWRHQLVHVPGLGRRAKRFACGSRVVVRSHGRVPPLPKTGCEKCAGRMGLRAVRFGYARQRRPRSRNTSVAVEAFRRGFRLEIGRGTRPRRRSPLSRKPCRFGKPRRRAATAKNGSTLRARSWRTKISVRDSAVVAFARTRGLHRPTRVLANAATAESRTLILARSQLVSAIQLRAIEKPGRPADQYNQHCSCDVTPRSKL